MQGKKMKNRATPRDRIACLLTALRLHQTIVPARITTMPRRGSSDENALVVHRPSLWMGVPGPDRELARLAGAARRRHQRGEGPADYLVAQGKRPLEDQAAGPG